MTPETSCPEKQPMGSYGHRIRTLAENRQTNCQRAGCGETANFQCSYRWRGGWKLLVEKICRMNLCLYHAREWALTMMKRKRERKVA